MSQLPLPLTLEDHAVFETFWHGENGAAVAWLEALCAQPRAPGGWLWSRAPAGKSHLLQAACDRVGDRAIYLPLAVLDEPRILDGLAATRVVCIDDAHKVAGDPAWERGLFNLFNGLTESGGALLVAAANPPADTDFRMPDLVSRFSQLAVFHLRAVADHDLRRALKLRARHRGLELPDETAKYLSRRSRRDMASLYALLDGLARKAMTEGRRLTIPFVKSAMDS